jgi:predicted transcriptional regulator
MRPASVIIDIEDSVMSIAKRFASQDHQYYYRGFPVMKNNRVVGRIILRDVLRAMSAMSEERVGTESDARPAAGARRTS